MAAPVVQSISQADFLFTESQISWQHVANPTGSSLGPPTGSGIALLVFVGAIDSEKVTANSVTYSGGPVPQPMTLVHETTGAGNSYPSGHVFVLTDPTFTGTLRVGDVTVEMDQSVTNINAMSVVVTGVDTFAGPLLGTPESFFDFNLTAGGGIDATAISGTITTDPAFDALIMDLAVAAAGLPDNHTPGADQTLVDTALELNKAGSAKLSVSYKVALSNGITGMIRENITHLNAVTSTVLGLKGNS